MRHAEISILAGGWSATRFDVNALPGFVIGVNESGVLARCDAVVSMDRLWTENRWARLNELVLPTWIRRAAMKNIHHRPFWVTVFENDHTSAQMSDQRGVLNGTNSGLCAVNLAYQMRPALIRLYGMDLANGPNRERHWHPDYEFKTAGKGTSDGTFRNWRADMDSAIAQCAAKGIEVRIMTRPEKRKAA